MVKIEIFETDLGVNQGLDEFNKEYETSKGEVLDFKADYSTQYLRVVIAIDNTKKE